MFESRAEAQAENFQKMTLAMAKDIRVILVKLADRLHNMRTLGHLSSEKRRRIARETLEIYAPIALRLGMNTIRVEFEELGFRALYPLRSSMIEKAVRRARGNRTEIVSNIQESIATCLEREGINAEVFGREKHLYSIYDKMRSKRKSFAEIMDVYAFRIIVDSVDGCYRSLGAVHNLYKPVAGRFKDYIAIPKANGYQSLHTTLFGMHGIPIEIQIRTNEMETVANNGIAGHYLYKSNEESIGGSHERAREWMKGLLEIQQSTGNSLEFIEHVKVDLFPDEVYVFSPVGEIFDLPQGATPVDFAYAVHSEVGDTCVGTKINGRPMPLRTELENGDQVEIITSPAQTPSPTWENFATTGKARARIRRFIRLRQREEYINLGKSILERAFQKEGYEFAEKAFDEVLTIFGADSVEDLYAEVGAGHATGREVIEAVFPGTKDSNRSKVSQLLRRRGKKKKADEKNSVPIKGLIPGMASHFAGCCHALPGDRIVGIVTKGRGITIHTIDCETLEEFADTPERWVDVAWEEDANSERRAGRIEIVVTNEPGSLGELSMVIAKNNGNINNLKITNRSQDFFDMSVDIEVHDIKHLRNIIAALRASPVINSVERARG